MTMTAPGVDPRGSQRTCPVCKKTFSVKHCPGRKRRYCSPKCKRKHQRESENLRLANFPSDTQKAFIRERLRSRQYLSRKGLSKWDLEHQLFDFPEPQEDFRGYTVLFGGSVKTQPKSQQKLDNPPSDKWVIDTKEELGSPEFFEVVDFHHSPTTFSKAQYIYHRVNQFYLVIGVAIGLTPGQEQYQRNLETVKAFVREAVLWKVKIIEGTQSEDFPIIKPDGELSILDGWTEKQRDELSYSVYQYSFPQKGIPCSFYLERNWRRVKYQCFETRCEGKPDLKLYHERITVSLVDKDITEITEFIRRKS